VSKTKIAFIALLLPGVMSAQAPVKKAFLEEFTTTLCGNCPPQSYNIHKWYEQHKSNSILLVHHAGFGTDKMTTTEASTYASYFQPKGFGFAPAIMIDRDVYPGKDTVAYMSVGGFDTIAQRISTSAAAVAVNINGTYNSTTRQLSVTATAVFATSVPSGPMRFHLYLAEDSLIGSGSGWDQKCYSSTWANQHYPGQYQSSTQYILQYPHRNVNRASLVGGSWGASNIIPNSPVLGTPYSVTATYTLPAGFNDKRISVIAMVAKYGPNHVSREVYNANSVKLGDLTTGTTNVSEQPQGLSINAMFPNPAVEEVTMLMTLNNAGNTTITVTNLVGQQVAVFEPGTYMNAGRYEATFSTSSLPPGMYVVNMKNNDEIITRKLTVSK
jgi:hypothetical protein